MLVVRFSWPFPSKLLVSTQVHKLIGNATLVLVNRVYVPPIGPLVPVRVNVVPLTLMLVRCGVDTGVATMSRIPLERLFVLHVRPAPGDDGVMPANAPEYVVA